jgi:hypothetical protein
MFGSSRGLTGKQNRYSILLFRLSVECRDIAMEREVILEQESNNLDSSRHITDILYSDSCPLKLELSVAKHNAVGLGAIVYVVGGGQ